jgi:hypothetical protein
MYHVEIWVEGAAWQAIRSNSRLRAEYDRFCKCKLPNRRLLKMDVQLSQAVTDITGLTGQKIIRAILAGERDPQTLAALREPGCKKSA